MNRAARRRATKELKRGVIIPNANGVLAPQYAGGPVTCDVCGVRFTPKPVEEPTPDGGVKMWLSCPSGHEFVIAHVDAEGVLIRRQIAAYGSQRGNEGIAVRMAHVASLKRDLQRHIVRGSPVG